MIKTFTKILFLGVLIYSTLMLNNASACTGSILAGNITPTDAWQTIAGVQAGERYTFNLVAGEVIIFSFCQGGGSYTNDPRIDIHNNVGTVTYEFNDDHCGYGSELVWVCPASGTYSVGFYEFYCLTNSAALGTVAYKKLPTPTEQDCLGARPLCSSFSNHPQAYSGTGHYYDIFNFNAQHGMAIATNNCPNCLVTGERNNVWYTFTAATAGNLAFSITPNNSADDYDWALYSLNNGVTCFDLINYGSNPPVSCNYSFGGSGTTGLGSGASSCVGPVENQLFNSTFAVTPGQTYTLVVSNFSATQNGYSINFGASTASIVDNIGPTLESLVYDPYCGSSSLTVQFSEAIWCQSAQPADFVLTGPAGTYNINDLYSIVCMSASANTYSGTWYDDVWTLQLGDLLSQSGDYTLTLLAGSVEDKCNNVNPANTLSFTIVGITADLNIVALAGCDGQSNGSLSVTNIAGGTPPYYIDWSGPAGFTSTDPAISNLAPGTYTVTITDDEGICELVETVVLTGSPPINPTASNNSPLCEGETLNLTGGSDDAASSYQWAGPGGYTSNAQNPSRASTTPGMAGTYSLLVTDSYGCTAGTTTDVLIYSVTPVSITTGSPYCEGETIQFNATTIIGASYSWAGPNAYSSNNEDPQIPNCNTTHAGLYQLIVTDVNSCSTSASANIVVNPGVTASLITLDPLCYQEPTGRITVNVSSGTPNYSYEWSNGTTANPAIGLGAGVPVCVTITDAANCSLSICHTLTDLPELTVTTSSIPTQCGFLEGEITAIANGGAGGYTYTWTGGHVGAHITGLHPGDYTLTLADANGCTEIVTENVGFFGQGTVSITQLQGISCFDDKTAVLQSSMTDGTLPFNYSWSVPGQTGTTLSGIGAGTYSVSISDVYGCSGEAIHIVTEPEKLTMLIEHEDVLCRGQNNGSATAFVNGGIYPYVYRWQHGPTSSHISALIAGTYTLEVEDLNGCLVSDFVVIGQPDKVLSMQVNTSDVSCAGRYDGMAITTGDGGTQPYIIYWFQFGQLIASGEQVQSLNAGNYSVEIFDDNNCREDANFSISEPTELMIGSEMSTVSCRGYNDGLIGIGISGGTFPYDIGWNTGDSVAVVENLTAGQYFVTITDGNGCRKTLGLQMTESSRLCLGIPDAFTPNGDGINDTWDIEYIDRYPAAVVHVFNRWGQHIYQGGPGTDYWDGRFNGNFVPAGAYQYIVDLRNGMDPFTGVVVVVY